MVVEKSLFRRRTNGILLNVLTHQPAEMELAYVEDIEDTDVVDAGEKVAERVNSDASDY